MAQTHDFSQGKISKNIMSLALPMTAAQLINVLYSVVDRMYLGRLPGHLALTGLDLTIPIISIIMGFANLCGTGGAPLCSIHRGRGDNEEAECVLGNAFTLLLIFGTAVTVFFLALRRPVLYLFGASDATYPYASAYMTIINSLREVCTMPVQGLSNGAQPVTGFNYGAKKYERVRQSIRFSVTGTVLYAAAFWAIAMLFPGFLIRIFNNEPDVIQHGIPALRIYFCLFIPMSLQMAGQGVFVSLGRSKQAVFFSLLRKAIINAPLTVILPIWMGTTGVFTAEAVSQLLGGMACILTMYFTVYRKLGTEAARTV